MGDAGGEATDGPGTGPGPVGVEALVARLVPARVRGLTAYHVPEPGNVIKLDAMENPYRWPRELVTEWTGRLAALAVNRYPDAGAAVLRARLRASIGIGPHLGLVLGNGSDELIQLLLLALAVPDGTVLAPEPSFSMYSLTSRAVGARYVGVPLAEPDFALPREAMLEAIARHRPVLTFLAYPNNPTGNLYAVEDVEAVVRAAPGVVVVDEAYAPFAEATLLRLLDEHPNLLVMRTLSKLGLAGLRVGYLVAQRAWTAELEKLRLPYNVNVLSQTSAAFALEHLALFEAQSARIRADREHLRRRLVDLPGLTVWPSRANFLLVRVPRGGGRAVFDALRERGVLVKCLDGSSPMLADCLRVTVGRPEENDALLGALAATLPGVA